MIDLHIHTTCSDGAFTVQQVIDRSKELALKAISITDHDTLDGYRDLPADPGLEIVPGIELSTFYGGKLVHLLGYFFGVHVSRVPCAVCQSDKEHRTQDTGHWKGLTDYLIKVRKRNQDVLKHICDHLREEEGIPVTYEELLKKGAVRPTLALLALRLLSRGYAKDWREVGAVWGRIHRELEGKYPPPAIEAGIKVLKEARALIVVAHPGSLPMNGKGLAEDGVVELKEMGVHGLEVYHKRHKPEDSVFYKSLAKKHQLAVSGGSDAHCRGKEPEIGCVSVEDGVLDLLRQRFAQIYG